MGKDMEGSAVASWVQCSSNSKTEETKSGPSAYKYVAITWNWQLNSIQYRAYKCTSNCLYALMVRCLINNKDDFVFNLGVINDQPIYQ